MRKKVLAYNIGPKSNSCNGRQNVPLDNCPQILRIDPNNKNTFDQTLSVGQTFHEIRTR